MNQLTKVVGVRCIKMSLHTLHLLNRDFSCKYSRNWGVNFYKTPYLIQKKFLLIFITVIHMIKQASYLNQVVR